MQCRCQRGRLTGEIDSYPILEPHGEPRAQIPPASSNYNGDFRNASDNDTTYIYAWTAF